MMKTISIRFLMLLILGFIASCIPSNFQKPLTQTVDNIDVEYYGFKREGTYLKTNICYEQSHNEYWHPNLINTSLLVEGQKISASNMELQTKSEHKDRFVCSNIEFPVGVSSNLGEVKLIIEELTRPVYVYDCEKAQKKLDEAHTGVVVNCDTPSIFGANISSFRVSKKPDNMNEDDAFEIAGDAFSDTANGPWEFAFVVNSVTVNITDQIVEEVALPVKSSVQGVEMELVSIERKEAYLTAKVCYTLPSGDIWKPDNSIMIMENQEVLGMTSWNRTNDRTDGVFCSEIMFPVGVSKLGQVELIIGQLETDMTKYDCAKAQKKLDDAGMDVIVDCSVEERYAITKMPRNMSDDETLELFGIVEDAFAEVIQGPWKFKFTVQ